MRFGSVCSGIEAASVAWEPLGWQAAWFSEIEPFPSAVLAHHYPETPNLGDITRIPALLETGEVEAPDILCGGTPCQAFSVAGLRRSLDDARGNLSLTFVEIANAIDNAREQPCIVFWENVPGVLSTKDNAFGCFLAGLAGEDEALVPPGGRWTDAGFVDGPQRAVAWRTLDAQYFGLAQRRRRVFVVASAREGFDPAAVLLEWEGVRRDSAPSREAGEGTAGRAEAGAGECSHWDGDYPHPTLNQSAKGSGGVGASNQEIFSQRGAYLAPAVCPTLRAGGNRTGGDRPPGTDVDTVESLQVVQPYIVGNTLTARMHKGINTTLDEGQTPVLAFDWQSGGDSRGLDPKDTAQLQRSPVPALMLPIGTDRVLNRVYEMHGQDSRVRDLGDACSTITSKYGTGGGNVPVTLAIGTDTYNGAITGDVAATISARNGMPDATGPRIMQAVAFQERGREHGRELEIGGDVAYALTAPSGGGRAQERNVMTPAMQVRRLTPVECERLMGFPDSYTAIRWRGKPASECPDGPRYKALGNSWAVPVVRWIGRRIADALA